MVWQPSGSVSNGDEGGLRCGVVRPSMQQNPLLAKAELGKVKPTMFNKPPPDHVFGYTLPGDPEHAREVTMIWKEHSKSPTRMTRPDGKPNLDFTKMNIMAAKSGLTTAKEQPSFRSANQTMVRKFDHTKAPHSPLPSDKSSKHSYGKPSTYRSADVVRNCGPEEPPIKHLVQGAYQEDWVKLNMQREGMAAAAGQGTYIPPVPTRAAIGHTIGAQQYLRPHHTGEEWKMSKFKKVAPKVPYWMGKTGGAAGPGGGTGSLQPFQHQQQQQEEQEQQQLQQQQQQQQEHPEHDYEAQ
uniref:Uncharacterized protein n=1 Tax=Dunaliella tertiolecta TaxID=3047 RepID=A0A7S3QQ17_DUNTE